MQQPRLGDPARTQHRWQPLLWIAIAAVLLAPLVAMQFSTEVAWTGFDFAVAAALLIGAGLSWEVARQHVSQPGTRALVALGLVAAVALAWAEGAVGLF